MSCWDFEQKKHKVTSWLPQYLLLGENRPGSFSWCNYLKDGWLGIFPRFHSVRLNPFFKLNTHQHTHSHTHTPWHVEHCRCAAAAGAWIIHFSISTKLQVFKKSTLLGLQHRNHSPVGMRLPGIPAGRLWKGAAVLKHRSMLVLLWQTGIPAVSVIGMLDGTFRLIQQGISLSPARHSFIQSYVHLDCKMAWKHELVALVMGIFTVISKNECEENSLNSPVCTGQGIWNTVAKSLSLSISICSGIMTATSSMKCSEIYLRQTLDTNHVFLLCANDAVML